ncbi:dolichyl-phosphate-mannose-protein mannosyltransferase [bacterium BMS3Abin06]|nr:dolichyl-phosphate-mannose-protein mannosyltransferase [bacterium BMS3Abin06]
MFLFAVAFGVRIHNINTPLLDFAPLRQYQSAHITRGYYLETLETVPEWKKEVARLNAKRMGLLLEPRILESATLLGYRILGGEYLWVPRVLSSIFWLIGGIFLYLTARKIASQGGALLSTAFYLFLPFGISASRAFQPDPMMIMMLLCSIFTILRYHEQPSISGLLIAAAASALAMFIKPYSLFLIFSLFISLAVYRHGIRKALMNPNLLIFTCLSFLPVVAYYIWGIFSNVGFLQEQAQASLLPQLLLKPYFWKDWLIMIGRVTGYIPFMAALLGFLIISRGLSRALLSGLWIGYFLFGLFFTVHIHTHEYYQLQFIPVVAFSIGQAGALAGSRLLNFLDSKKRVIIFALLLIVTIAGMGLAIRQMQREGDKKGLRTAAAFIGINTQFPKFIKGDFRREVKIAEEIGEIVGHSTNTVLLTPNFGRVIAYYGELSGLPWPISGSLRERKERGLRIPGKEELFNERYLLIRTHGKYIKYTPDFFIITDFREFENQTDLKEFLNANFPVTARTEDYLIFDLSSMSGLNR